MTAQVTQIEQESVQPVPIQYYGFRPETYKEFTFGLEPTEHCVEELRKIHTEHWNETEVLYLSRPMDPDYDSIISMEANRQFVLFTIRDDSGTLVGNFGFYLALSTHFKNQLMAKEDFFFITKEHRGGGLARNFYQYAERCLVQLGVKLIGVSDKAPCGGKSLEPLLAKEGFKPVSTAYVKEVF